MSFLCKCFGYGIEDGSKAFCIAEFFVAIFNIARSIETGSKYAKDTGDRYMKNKDAGTTEFFDMIFVCLLVFTLFLQGLLGLLLYPLGWRKRNVSVTWAWIIGASINFVVLLCVGILSIPDNKLMGRSIMDDKIHLPGFVIYSFLYFLYVPYGILILVYFNKWAKTSGVAVEFLVHTVKSRGTQSHHNHEDKKVVSDDEEGEEAA